MHYDRIVLPDIYYYYDKNLLVVIAEQGGKHEALDCEHVSALRWASSSLKQTPAAWEGTYNSTVVSMHKLNAAEPSLLRIPIKEPFPNYPHNIASYIHKCTKKVSIAQLHEAHSQIFSPVSVYKWELGAEGEVNSWN